MSTENIDVVIVGAGFAGLYMLHKTRELGLSAKVLEAGSGLGGTWFWNRYPGARCDIESMEYSYQFSDELQQEWEWTERYASQPEILKYANHVADRYDLRRDIQFNTRVKSAAFDEAKTRWTIETETGEAVVARFCVMATGCLSSTNTPAFDGLESFTGDIYHTGTWPHDGVDFTGKRVGVIGTGSSAVQSIPIIAKQAKHLHVFQRTPNHVVPAHNAPMDAEYQAHVKAHYPERRAKAKTNRSGVLYEVNETPALDASPEERQREYQARWDNGGLGFMGSFYDLLLNKEANNTAQDFIRERISEIVTDAKTAELLSPKTVVGCKRLCIDTGYFETYNQDNVSLIDVSSTPIDKLTPTGLRVGDTDYAFDAIVFATGFDAMTGALTKIDIRGTSGQALTDKWAAGPRTYLGLAIAGFPNLFTVTGPGSPSVLSNMLPSIEQHIEWISDCLGHLQKVDKTRIEASVPAEDGWVEHVNSVADQTLFPSCNSWYLGANVPGKPRVFMPYIGFPAYLEKCNEVVANGYEGFNLT